MATTTKRPPADPETDDLGLGFDYWFLQVARVRRVEEYRRCQAVVRHAYPQVPDSLGPLDDEYCAAWRTAIRGRSGNSTALPAKIAETLSPWKISVESGEVSGS